MAEYYYITYITLAAFDTSGSNSATHHAIELPAPGLTWGRLLPGSLKAHCTEQHIWDYKNLREKVGVIEISRNGVLEKAYFVIPPVCQVPAFARDVAGRYLRICSCLSPYAMSGTYVPYGADCFPVRCPTRCPILACYAMLPIFLGDARC